MGDEQYFLKVEQELKDEKIDKALWVKASVLGSDDQDIRKQYIILRVEELKKEAREEKKAGFINLISKILTWAFGALIVFYSVMFAYITYDDYQSETIAFDGLSCWRFPNDVDFENNDWLNSPYMSEDGLKEAGGTKSYFMLRGKRRLASSDTLSKYRIIQRADTKTFIYAKESFNGVFCRRDTTCFVTGNSVPINDRTETLYEIESYQDRGAEILLTKTYYWIDRERTTVTRNYCKIISPDELKSESGLYDSS